MTPREPTRTTRGPIEITETFVTRHGQDPPKKWHTAVSYKGGHRKKDGLTIFYRYLRYVVVGAAAGIFLCWILPLVGSLWLL